MSDDRNDPFADVINVLAAPIAGGIRSMEQFQRGIGELFRAIDNLNTTLETLNETATRVNRLVEDIEEPVRAMIPQLTRSIRAADEMTALLEGPVRSAAPNIERVAETLSSPGFSALPNQLSEFVNVVGDVSKRLAPLTQFAENAGGLFGGLRMPGMPQPTKSGEEPARSPAAPANTATKKTPARQAAPSKRAAKTTSAAKKTGAAKANATKKATPAKKPAKKKASGSSS